MRKVRMIRDQIVSFEVWLGGEFGVVISWEMLLKNSRREKDRKGEIG